MKSNIFITIFAAVVVTCLNFPGFMNKSLSSVQIIAGTMTVLFLLICYQVYSYFSHLEKPVKTGKITTSQPDGITKETKLPPFNPDCNVEDLVSTVLNTYKSSEAAISQETVQRLKDELDTYRQSYLWCIRMQQLYGDRWTGMFQCATLPLEPAEYSKMRSLIAEVALQTVDFCRYRTRYINLTERMQVNPRMILLGCSPAEAGAKSLSDNPFEIPKEVLALQELFLNDKVQLTNASIHGYIPNNNND